MGVRDGVLLHVGLSRSHFDPVLPLVEADIRNACFAYRGLPHAVLNVHKSGSPRNRKQNIRRLRVHLPTLRLHPLKTKNFHWHVSGPHFRDYHLLLDEQADQLYATTDVIAERVRKIGGTTLRSIGHIARMQRVLEQRRRVTGWSCNADAASFNVRKMGVTGQALDWLIMTSREPRWVREHTGPHGESIAHARRSVLQPKGCKAPNRSIAKVATFSRASRSGSFRCRFQ